MPSENNRRLQKAIAPVLKVRGFHKNGATWRRDGPTSIGVLNLQGSQWAPFFYINLGVFLLALGKNPRPLEYECHLRTRLGDLVPDRGRLHGLLSFEAPIEDDHRVADLSALIAEYAVPWLDRVSALDGALDYARGLSPKSPFVSAELKRLLQRGPGV
jgi:hypothetical protein